MPYFDTHAHATSSDADAYPAQPLGGTRSEWSRTRPVDVSGLIRNLDAAGVERAALVHASTVYGFDNRYAADALSCPPTCGFMQPISGLRGDATTTLV
ncbi:hypothetical protein ACIHCV_18960 [Streptomyces sp. NPDC051956]|uniref:hypothetical protein n=1 Tax=Streptomyces sp. NPDC051956 TaxID=3365677 RepID=UPI0037D217CA